MSLSWLANPLPKWKQRTLFLNDVSKWKHHSALHLCWHRNSSWSALVTIPKIIIDQSYGEILEDPSIITRYLKCDIDMNPKTLTLRIIISLSTTHNYGKKIMIEQHYLTDWLPQNHRYHCRTARHWFTTSNKWVFSKAAATLSLSASCLLTVNKMWELT